MNAWFKFMGALALAHRMAKAFCCSPREATRVLDNVLNAYGWRATP